MNYLYSLLLQSRVFARRRVSRRTGFVHQSHRYDQVSHTKYDLWNLNSCCFQWRVHILCDHSLAERSCIYVIYGGPIPKTVQRTWLTLRTLIEVFFQNLIPTIIFKSGRVGNFRPIFFIFCISCVRNQPGKFANQGQPKVSRSFGVPGPFPHTNFGCRPTLGFLAHYIFSKFR